MTLPDSIMTALRQAPDYSAAFTSRVTALAAALALDASIPVSHDADMNYRHGQSLSFISVDPLGHRPMSRSGPIEVRVYVSSCANLYAIYCFDLKQAYMPSGGLNHPISLDLIPEFARRQIEACRRVMNSHGYAEVSPLLFDELAPGCLTDMDGLPANIFQALFAEVV